MLNKSKTSHAIACATMGALILLSANKALAQLKALPSADQLPTQINCTKGVISSDIRAAVFATAIDFGVKTDPSDWKWLTSLLKQGDLPSKPIGSYSMMTRSSFQAQASLIKNGYLVSALMIHDGSLAIDDYKGSINSNSIKSLLVTSVQPSNHPEEETPKGTIQNNVYLAQTMQRIGVAKAGLGSFYTDTPAKYFIRAHGYKDAIGIEASRRLLCASELTAAQLQAIGAAAEYVKTGRTPPKAVRQKGVPK